MNQAVFSIHLDMPDGLIGELFSQEDLAALARLGRLSRRSSSDDPGARRQADIVVTGWGSQPFRGVDEVKLLVHSGGSVRGIVPKSMLSLGVVVSQASVGMGRSVAELAVALCLALMRDLPRFERQMQVERQWIEVAAPDLGDCIADSRFAVVGASRVGRRFIELVQAFGAKVDVFDPLLSRMEGQRLGVEVADLETILKRADVLSLHAPSTPETRQMIGAAQLAMLHDGAIVINTARAHLVDDVALVAELTSGRLRAGLDVFPEEPLDSASPLWQLPNVILTPHVGAATQLSRREQGRFVVEEIRRWVSGEDLRGQVTIDNYDVVA